MATNRGWLLKGRTEQLAMAGADRKGRRGAEGFGIDTVKNSSE
jgi:hypothetical protein